MFWDVIVVGAGIEGSATAYSLAKAGQKTLLLEQFMLPHSRGSSHGRSRITRKSYPEDFYAKMMIDGYDAWKQLEQEEETQLYIPTGLVMVADAGSEYLDIMEKALRHIDCQVDRLDSDLLRKRFPLMNFDNSHSAIYEHDAGVLLADKCLSAFQNQFKARGGVICDGEPVLKIEPSSDERVCVQTTKGEHNARHVIITAGPWTNKVLQPLGLQLPLKPLQVVVWHWKQLQNGHSMSDGFPAFVYLDGRDVIYGLPAHESSGLVKVGVHGGHEIADPDQRYEVSADDRYLQMVSQFVSRHLPGVEAKPSITEICKYTLTSDDNFILDCHPKWKNVVIGAGFSGVGFKFAPVVGKILSDLATGKNPPYDLNPFKISRFLDSKPMNPFNDPLKIPPSVD